ncbi:DUF6542 domain-containing protein [Corynebacterium nuruki]|uniref:DUF6542 domain-containing protein n=1 Tax=Corynebacterium nuruki TaxID=1032851 RepID=UPI00024855D0|nr:DUF6542 domain-containing protein [Corynebacterium nuruki]
MTTDTSSPEPVPQNRRGFIPTWAPVLIMLAVFFTGLVLGDAGTPYAVLFAVACLVCTALVELRGMFLTVSLIPVYWFCGIGAVGMIGADSSGSRKTQVITAAYPAVQHYMWLLATFVVCLVVALLRYRLDAAARERTRRAARARRRRLQEADSDNRRVATRARTVERPAGPRPSATAPARSKTTSPTKSPTTAATPASPAAGPAAAPERPSVRSRHSLDEEESTPSPATPPTAGESRTRSAAELRAASERRRNRHSDQPAPERRPRRYRAADRPLDLDD